MVRLRKGVRSVRLDGALQVSRSPAWTPGELAEAVHKAMEVRDLHADQVVLGTPLSELFVRGLSFPFASRSKVAQVLPLEMERELPVDPETLAMTFCPAGMDRGGYRFLAGAMPRASLDSWVDGFAAVGITLDGVDASPFGAGALCSGLERTLPESVLVFGLEKGRGEALLLHRGTVVAMTGIALAFVQERGVDGPGKEGRDLDTHALARDAAHRLRLFLLSCGDVPDVEQVLLYGEGSRIEGLGSALELALGVPVQNLDALPQLSLLREIEAQGLDPAVYVAALGLALRGPHGTQGFDFLGKGAGERSGRLSPRRALMHLGAAAVVVFCAWGIVSGLRLRDAHQARTEIEAKTTALFREVVPEVRGTLRFSQYASVLRDRIRSVSGTGPAVSGPTYRVVDDLLGISSAVGSGREVQLDFLTLDDRTLRMTGTADGFGTVEGIKQELGTVPGFQDVSIKGAKADADGQGVSFSMELVRSDGGAR
jgi:hypothetical protein